MQAGDDEEVEGSGAFEAGAQVWVRPVRSPKSMAFEHEGIGWREAQERRQALVVVSRVWVKPVMRRVEAQACAA